MSIAARTAQGETITRGWRALELFTDRHEAIRLFASYLNDDPPPEKILYFHGDGGNGKSLLLGTLRGRYCKRLDRERWAFVSGLADSDIAAALDAAESVGPVPAALVDFGMQPRGDDRPQEAFSALLMLHRQLAGQGLYFPLFDFACVLYLHKTGKLTKERLASLFPEEEIGFLSTLADAASGTAIGSMVKATLGIVGKYLGKLFGFHERWQSRCMLYLRKRKLDQDRVEEIQRMDPEVELIERLPGFFAEDLNAALSLDGAPKRVVLFFDTHEAFWGDNRDLAEAAYFRYDEWLRCLLASLEFSRGVVAVVAGREPPRWHSAERVAIPSDYVNTQLVGHLSGEHADEYLQRAGVANADMRRCLIQSASVAPDQVHPFYLGLCADIALAATQRGETLRAEDFGAVPEAPQKGRALMHRLLFYVDSEIGYAAKALCACRAFNEEIYGLLGKTLNFRATAPAFRVLTEFSFVWRAESRGQGWYRIHDLLRRLVREDAGQDGQLVRQADEVLEKHYRQRGCRR